jgi:hypothetical protein
MKTVLRLDESNYILTSLDTQFCQVENANEELTRAKEIASTRARAPGQCRPCSQGFFDGSATDEE